MIIAVDGPVASGKGTLARRLARELDLAYLDTGMIYRAVAARLLEAGVDPDDEAAVTTIAGALSHGDLERPDLRAEIVSQVASKVAALPAVRALLLNYQRRFAAEPPGGRSGAVLDGRDIGTIVSPEADIKMFVTANVETRAARRHKELLDRGEKSIYARVLKELQERDSRDSGRSVAPLRAAEDAVVLDTTGMDAEAALARALEIIRRKRPRDAV